MAASAKSKVVGDTHPFDVKDYDSYSWVLLEDHPLRSYPTTYPPGLFNFLGRWYATAKRWWAERGMSLVSLFVMFLMVIQFIANLPYGVSYLFIKDLSDEADLAKWPAEFSHRPSACISYDPYAHDAIDRAIYAGCAGTKVDAWVLDDDIAVGDSSHPNPNNTLRTVYLEPLMAKLDARNPAVASSASPSPVPAGLFDHDPAQPFVLFLQLHPSVSSAWPHLMAQLALLAQRGYLSYTDGVQVFRRPVSIVATGMNASEIDFVKNISHDRINDSIVFIDTPIRRLDPIGSDRRIDLSADSDTPRPENESEGSPSRLSSGVPSTLFGVTVNFRETIGSPRRGRFSVQQVERIKAQIYSAHRQGLTVRYHAIPCLPRALRRIVWRVLVHEGADYIEMDGRCEGRSLRSVFTIGWR